MATIDASHTADELREEDKSSPCSSPLPSPTSTACYSQEGFDCYRQRVLNTVTPLLPDATDQPEVYKLPGGGYNRITGITVMTNTVMQQFIYRTPRYLEPVEKAAAMLHYLEKNSALPTPRIVAERPHPYDPTYTKTAFGRFTGTASLPDREEAYILMPKMEGTSLHLVYENFSVPQKIDMARQFANLMADMFALPVPQATGNLEVNLEGRLVVSPFIYNPSQVLPAPTEDRFLRPSEDDLTAPGCVEFLSNSFDYMRRAKEYKSDDTCYPRIFKKLSTSVERILVLRKEELETPDPLVFIHCDLAARNILARSSDGENSLWTISGILDWDECVALPPLLAYWSPNWLWIEAQDDGITPCLGWEFNRDPDEGPLTDDARAIRSSFVDAIEARIPGYMDVVRLGRSLNIKQMLYIAQHGTFDPLADDLLDEIYETAGIPKLWDKRAPSLGGGSWINYSCDELVCDDTDSCLELEEDEPHTDPSVHSISHPASSIRVSGELGEAQASSSKPCHPKQALAAHAVLDDNPSCLPPPLPLSCPAQPATLSKVSSPAAAMQANMPDDFILQQSEHNALDKSKVEPSEKSTMATVDPEETAHSWSGCFYAGRAFVKEMHIRRREKVLKRRQKCMTMYRVVEKAFRELFV